MPTERWREAETVFAEALDHPPDMRAPFVARRCSDAAIRDEVTSLLRAAEESRDFLEAPALDVFARQVSREGWSVRAGDRIAAYTVIERLGAGGMGEVWRARDDRLGRDVAIKLLLPHPTDTAGRVRAFEREARAAGALNHPNVLTLYDVGDHGGAPYLVTECLDGESLRARLDRGPLGIDTALEIALGVARGLGAAHAGGVVHRDLKPENIFLAGDGRVKILDFGLASLRAAAPDASGLFRPADPSARTLDGGTAGYMAPEQMRGEPVDPRADIFALGAVVYEMLAGERPFRAGPAADALSMVLTHEPPDLSQVNPHVPAALARIVGRCLAKAPNDRFAAITHLVAELDAVVRDRHPRGSPGIFAPLPRPAVRAIVLVALVAIAAGAWRWRIVESRGRWARDLAAPEIRRLANTGDYTAAFLLARRALDVLPDDPQLRQLWLDVTTVTDVTTNPPGADVAIAAYRPPAGEWVSLGRTPLKSVRIPRGMSRLRIDKAGFQPVDGSLHAAPGIRFDLFSAEGSPAGMVRVTGGGDRVRFGPVAGVDGFWIDRREVTNREFKRFVDRNGYQDRRYWREPFVDRGRPLTWAAAMERFRDRSGRGGPAGWAHGTYPDGEADFPVGGVSWYEAAAYAQFAGKSLPTMYHWYRAAALGRFADILTVSNFNGTGPAPVGKYEGLGPFGTVDMAGNVKEWCWNETGGNRFLLGGAWNEPRYMYANHDAQSPFARNNEYGLRLAKYDSPPAAAIMDAVPSPGWRPDRAEPPVRDDVFEVFRRVYAYDTTPLNAVVESTSDGGRWVQITVALDAAYGGERMRTHLFLPKQGSPPYQTVVFFPGGDAFNLTSSRDMALGAVDLIVGSGRALLYPVYKGTYERAGVRPAGANAEREINVSWSRDLGRALDYAETRPDIDRQRVAYYGISSGADAGILLTALEPRLKASVLQATGLWPAATPETHPRHFAPRVRVPTLLLTGRYDFVMPYESQRALFELLGPRPPDKEHKVFDTGHAVPVGDSQGVILPWLDRYLSPVVR